MLRIINQKRKVTRWNRFTDLVTEVRVVAAPVDHSRTYVAEAVKIPKGAALVNSTRDRIAYKRDLVLLRDKQLCGYCGGRATAVDHIVPKSRGGSNSWLNTIACCVRCNNEKADKLLLEYHRKLRFAPTHCYRETLTYIVFRNKIQLV